MKLLICAGGTGGGVYPALAVLQAIINKLACREKGSVGVRKTSSEHIKSSILWVGSKGGMEQELVNRADISFEPISAAGVHGVGVKALPGNLRKLYMGYMQSHKILKRFQPDVLFFTGGYVAIPMAFAGYKVPSLLYVPDIEPGLALKAIAFMATIIDITNEETRKYFSIRKDIRVTGYPSRKDILSWERSAAYSALDLSPGLPTLLVLGGSRGARSINRALLASLPDFIKEMQIVHISGNLDWMEVKATWEEMMDSLPHPERYKAFPYLHEQMGAALRVADLVVSRAGASILGDYPCLGLPAILVPYPHAWRYQIINARMLELRGAAQILMDEELGTKLFPQAVELIKDKERLKKMSEAMLSLANRNAAESIADHLYELARRTRIEN